MTNLRKIKKALNEIKRLLHMWLSQFCLLDITIALESLEHESESGLSWHLTLINRIKLIILVQPNLYLLLCRNTRFKTQTLTLWMKPRTIRWILIKRSKQAFKVWTVKTHMICPAGLKLCYTFALNFKGTKARRSHDPSSWWILMRKLKNTVRKTHKILQKIKTWAPISSRLPLSSE